MTNTNEHNARLHNCEAVHINRVVRSAAREPHPLRTTLSETPLWLSPSAKRLQENIPLMPDILLCDPDDWVRTYCWCLLCALPCQFIRDLKSSDANKSGYTHQLDPSMQLANCLISTLLRTKYKPKILLCATISFTLLLCLKLSRTCITIY